MHASRFFLFYMISLSVFSCSASEKQVTQNLSQQIIKYTPIINRLDRGESGVDIVLSIARGAVNGIETVRQGYVKLSDSPTTETIITNVQAGAETVATHAYSAGVTLYTATHNLLQWAYNQRYQQNSLSFDMALSRYNQQMPYVLNTPNKEECKQGVIKNLTTIKTDISAITTLINTAKGITKNNASGIRTTIIDYIIANVTSDENMTDEKVSDYVKIINEIAKFSKTEDGQNNLEESIVESAIINDEKQLVSELEKADNPDNNAFSAFIQKYMSNDSTMRAVLENKKIQNDKKEIGDASQNTINNTNQDALLIEQLKQVSSQVELQTQQIIQMAQSEIEKYKSTISTLTNEIQEHQTTIQRLKIENTRIETEKQTINSTMLQQAKQEEKLKENLKKEQNLKAEVEQEKTKLEGKIQQLWSFVKIGGVITVSAIAVLIWYFELYKQYIALSH